MAFPESSSTRKLVPLLIRCASAIAPAAPNCNAGSQHVVCSNRHAPTVMPCRPDPITVQDAACRNTAKSKANHAVCSARNHAVRHAPCNMRYTMQQDSLQQDTMACAGPCAELGHARAACEPPNLSGSPSRVPSVPHVHMPCEPWQSSLAGFRRALGTDSGGCSCA